MAAICGNEWRVLDGDLNSLRDFLQPITQSWIAITVPKSNLLLEPSPCLVLRRFAMLLQPRRKLGVDGCTNFSGLEVAVGSSDEIGGGRGIGGGRLCGTSAICWLGT